MAEKEPRRIVGPLGIWPYPVLNAILEVFRRFRERRQLLTRAGTSSSSLSPTMANEEVWEWTDYRGRKRQITVRREVKE